MSINFALKTEQSRDVPLVFDWKIIRFQLANVPVDVSVPSEELPFGILFFKTASSSPDNCVCGLDKDDEPCILFFVRSFIDEHRLQPTHVLPTIYKVIRPDTILVFSC